MNKWEKITCKRRNAARWLSSLGLMNLCARMGRKHNARCTAKWSVLAAAMTLETGKNRQLVCGATGKVVNQGTLLDKREVVQHGREVLHDFLPNLL